MSVVCCIDNENKHTLTWDDLKDVFINKAVDSVESNVRKILVYIQCCAGEFSREQYHYIEDYSRTFSFDNLCMLLRRDNFNTNDTILCVISTYFGLSYKNEKVIKFYKGVLNCFEKEKIYMDIKDNIERDIAYIILFELNKSIEVYNNYKSSYSYQIDVKNCKLLDDIKLITDVIKMIFEKRVVVEDNFYGLYNKKEEKLSDYNDLFG